MYFDRRLWQLTRGLRGWIVLAILLGLVASVVGIARFEILGVLLSHVFDGAGLFAIAVPAVGVAVAVILRGLVDHHRAMISHRTATRVQEELRGRLYDKIAALGPAWFAGERTGGVMLSVVDGVEQLQSFFGQYVPQLSIAVLTPLAIFVFIAFWDVPVATVMLFFALVTLVAPTVFVQIERRSSHGRQQALKSFGSEFLDGVQGLPTLKAFGQSTAYGRRLADKARELCDSTLRVLSTGVMTRGITDCGVAIGAAAALSLAAWRVSQGLMSIEALLIVLMAGTEVFRPLRDLRMVLHQGMVGQSAAAGINTLLNSSVTKIAIANPAHAPYGKRAEESLRYYQLDDQIIFYLVIGEIITQTVLYAQTVAADIGIASPVAPVPSKTGVSHWISSGASEPKPNIPSGALKSHEFSDSPIKSRMPGSLDQPRRSAARINSAGTPRARKPLRSVLSSMASIGGKLAGSNGG